MKEEKEKPRPTLRDPKEFDIIRDIYFVPARRVEGEVPEQHQRQAAKLKQKNNQAR